jgi:hypothetical protein
VVLVEKVSEFLVRERFIKTVKAVKDMRTFVGLKAYEGARIF